MTARQQAIYTLDELAAYLEDGKRTLYRLAAHGDIPAFKGRRDVAVSSK